ncbi:DEAD/DEAH box helicase [Marinicella sediminis]|uniref:ATP-dependent RNA helicase RhlE n=1 Tax=Marinicella sediminis TaxID=1792834 RepID=A0ABV7JBR9_9GAMM
MKFTELGLSAPLQKAVAAQGYDTPSPIQAQAIPAVLTGKDVMAAAQTGTGKTAGFTLPILERLSQGQSARFNQVRALILTPTRELAAQVEASVVTYGKHLDIRSTVVFGGVKINPQMMRLRRGVDVLVATPGRLLDLYSQNAVHFDDLEVLVLDEADRMLDMGFIHDIKRIIKLLPKKRQNLMFSATFSPEIKQLAKTITHHPIEIAINPEVTTAEKVAQVMHPVDKKRKKELLLHLVANGQWQQVLVFSRTKHGANKLSDYLNKFGVSSMAIHGNKSQGARTKALAQFKQGKVRVLVATDIAARGIDIDLLPHVVNVDLPNVPEDYVHRIGRTGRAGANGEAVSLVSADEYQQLFDIEKLLGHPLKREYVDDYEPTHDVPVSKKAMRTQQSVTKASHKRPQKPGKKPNNTQAAKSTQRPWDAEQKKKIKKPKKRPFVKAAVKEKWANRSEEENQAARARSQKAKQGQPRSQNRDDNDDNRGNQRKPFKGKKPTQGQRSGQGARSGKGGYQGKAKSAGQRSGKPSGNQRNKSNRSGNSRPSRHRSAG